MKRTIITAAAVLLAAAGANAKTYDMKCGFVTVNDWSILRSSLWSRSRPAGLRPALRAPI